MWNFFDNFLALQKRATNEILIQAQWKQSLAVESMISSIYQLNFSCKLKPTNELLSER